MIHRDDQIQFESESDHSGVCSDEESELKLWEGECSRMAEDDYTQPKGGGEFSQRNAYGQFSLFWVKFTPNIGLILS